MTYAGMSERQVAACIKTPDDMAEAFQVLSARWYEAVQKTVAVENSCREMRICQRSDKK